MKSALALLLCTSVVGIAGCGGGAPAELIESRRSAQQAYDEGLQAIESKDFAIAEQRLTEALEAGGLYPDLYDSAQANLVAALAGQGKLEAAQKSLADLKKTAEQKDLVLAAQSFLLEKQGKTKQAKQAWSRARKFNRYVKRFSE